MKVGTVPQLHLSTSKKSLKRQTTILKGVLRDFYLCFFIIRRSDDVPDPYRGETSACVEFNYIGEFEAILQTVLSYKPGDSKGNNKAEKSRETVPVNHISLFYLFCFYSLYFNVLNKCV